ncbi:hypothetical protein BDZ97DRAFT_986310 [Flammula alnicola]|nr:hypothetical protein BDZ97DRAFT_986310 [Flammula alnicola]
MRTHGRWLMLKKVESPALRPSQSPAYSRRFSSSLCFAILCLSDLSTVCLVLPISTLTATFSCLGSPWWQLNFGSMRTSSVSTMISTFITNKIVPRREKFTALDLPGAGENQAISQRGALVCGGHLAIQWSSLASHGLSAQPQISGNQGQHFESPVPGFRRKYTSLDLVLAQNTGCGHLFFNCGRFLAPYKFLRPIAYSYAYVAYHSILPVFNATGMAILFNR